MQKLVTIYLSNYFGDTYESHSQVSEHLADLLENGWRIVSLSPAGCSVGGETDAIAAWIAVVLENPSR